jgi:hypothetical protein
VVGVQLLVVAVVVQVDIVVVFQANLLVVAQVPKVLLLRF